MIQEIPYQKELAKIAQEHNIEAYYVGGLVRDRLLGRASKDIDIVTVGSQPEVLLKLLRDHINGGEVAVVGRYGTSQLTTPDGVQIEGVRARAESYDLDSRKPLVRIGTLQDDILRRDFTINCLIAPVSDPENILDPTGMGLRDLRVGVIRTPLEPAQTFSDDPLRMLRAVRFATKLEFAINSTTMNGIRAAAPRMRIISAERISAELDKILLSQAPGRGLELLADAHLLEQILPEIHTRWENDGRDIEYDLDATPADLSLRLAVLFRRTGAPNAHTGNQAAVALCRKRLNHLRYPADEVRLVSKLVDLFPRVYGYNPSADDTEMRQLIYAAGREMPLAIALARSCASRLKSPQPVVWDNLESRCATLDPKGLICDHVLPLDGEIIMETMGIDSGPAVGEVKRDLQQAILAGEIQPDDRAQSLAWLAALREPTHSDLGL